MDSGTNSRTGVCSGADLGTGVGPGADSWARVQCAAQTQKLAIAITGSAAEGGRTFEIAGLESAEATVMSAA